MFVAQLRRALLAVLCSVPAIAVSACIAPQYPLGADNDQLSVGRLRSVWPVEVVVPPVKNVSGEDDLPLERFRSELRRGLVHRRYTPLAQGFVDRSITEASYRPGSLGEQAVLEVTITGWNTSRWRSHAALTVDLDIVMLDATDPDPSKALWGGHATRNVDLSRERNSYLSEAALLDRAVEVAVEGVLASLPRREGE
ncbi:MAG: hypothetical protein IT454_08600 [Planctomycetes bacterium]|nr:hypothetical protein [Planctomycetota bacterium]